MANGILKIGIVGGGQLARMLCLRGWELGYEMHILCKDQHEPAAQVTHHWHQGDGHRYGDLAKFAKIVDILTIESEFYNADQFLRVQSKHQGLPIWPSPASIALLQDRIPQKESLKRHGIATARFMDVDSKESFAVAAETFKKGFVLKQRTHGYDGYGTHVFRSPGRATWQAQFANHKWLAEEFIPFDRELAVLLVRSRDNSIIDFPLVESHQVDNRCDWVLGPTQNPNYKKLLNQLRRYLVKIDFVGAIAFELFEIDQKLFVNEVAPRVHNSAHYTMDAFQFDQFHCHLLAISGKRLRAPQALTPGFVMVNLIGKGGKNIRLPDKIESHLHWYGKNESRMGRKMGHLNRLLYKNQSPSSLAKSLKKLVAITLKERNSIKL